MWRKKLLKSSWSTISLFSLYGVGRGVGEARKPCDTEEDDDDLQEEELVSLVVSGKFFGSQGSGGVTEAEEEGR